LQRSGVAFCISTQRWYLSVEFLHIFVSSTMKDLIVLRAIISCHCPQGSKSQLALHSNTLHVHHK